MSRIFVYHIQGTIAEEINWPSSSGVLQLTTPLTVGTSTGGIVSQNTANTPNSGVVSTVNTANAVVNNNIYAVSSKKHNKNVNYRVATYDVESAVKMAKEKYPNLFITAVSMKDKIDEVDPQVVLEIFNNGKDSN